MKKKKWVAEDAEKNGLKFGAQGEAVQLWSFTVDTRGEQRDDAETGRNVAHLLDNSDWSK